MNWQSIIAIICGLIALTYVVKVFKKQLNVPEIDPKCNNCPIPSLLQGDEKN